MFRLAVPKGVHDNRTISFLKNEQEMIETEHFTRASDGNGLVDYTFPNMEEDNFRYIVAQLQHQGVTMIGVDTQLTEKKIMKLASLIEMTPLDKQGESSLEIVKDIKKILSQEEDPTSSLWIKIADIIGAHEEKIAVDDIASTDYDRDFYNVDGHDLHHNRIATEQKLRKVIRKMIRQ